MESGSSYYDIVLVCMCRYFMSVFGLCFGVPCLCAGLMLHHLAFVGSKAMCVFMHTWISRVCSMKIIAWYTTPTTQHIPQWSVVLQGFLAMNFLAYKLGDGYPGVAQRACHNED